MSKLTNEELLALIQKAVAGDKESLETVLSSVQDLVFNLSLRMLGTFPDAEDASQDIILKVITHLSSFRKESAFSTWVFRIAVNHLKNYKKHMFSQFPLSFDFTVSQFLICHGHWIYRQQKDRGAHKQNPCKA